MPYTFLKKKNNGKSILNGSISGSDSSVILASLSTFPESVEFLCTIWDKVTYPDPTDDPNMEIVKVTSISSGFTFNITRAQEGTLARAHSTGHAIELLITAGQITELETQINAKIGAETDPVFVAWLATPPNVSIFTNDAGYLTSFTETDPVFVAWLATPPDLSEFNNDTNYAVLPIDETEISLSNITTNNATTLRHGFLPQLSGNAIQYLDGSGNYSTPTAGVANSYTLVSFSSQTTVNVVHNFSTYPVVQVINNLGEIEIPLSIVHNTVNDFTVTFSASTTGSIVATVGSPQPQSVIVVNSNYAILSTDEIIRVSAFDVTITMPSAVNNTGRKFTITNSSFGDIFVDTTSSQTISGELIQTIPSGSSMTVFSDGANYFII